MLQKFRFTLACTEPGTVRGLGGLELHALFFSFLREVEEEAARELHGAKDKPFALGPLEGAGERRGGSFYLQAGEKYGFTVTSLTGAMYRLLEEVAALWPGREVQLGTGALACVDAGTTRAEDLNYRDLVARARPATTVTLEFLTPTSFRQRGTQILFPLPEYVFGSLRQRWNAHGPIRLPEDLDLSLIQVARYRARTQLVPFNRYKIVGFTGTCTYQVPKKVPDFVPWLLAVLADYAEFAGVGYKTTMGMGVVRRW
ncbi:MAG: CRISPR-associated endoribonuclease Cas6 [bacterium]|jgi:CRISPR-associated endoribonuclease Cas6|nr:CRISPR-associated endoribonuclease Cas6 [Bacillota bacterium]